jgi:hypothetical protein
LIVIPHPATLDNSEKRYHNDHPTGGIMQTQESIALFQQLREKYGTHAAAAVALRVPRRTYSDWMARGFSTEQKWLPALSHMRALLNDTTNASSGDIRNGA